MESIKECESKIIDKQFYNLYEMNIFNNLKFLNSEILKLKIRDKYYSKYLCNFMNIIFSYYFDEKFEKNIEEYNNQFNSYKEGKIKKKAKLYSNLIKELEDYNLNNFRIDKLTAKIKFEIYFYLSVFGLYLKGLQNNINMKEKIYDIFIGKNTENKFLDIIDELIKDDKIFEEPKFWLNSYNLFH